MGEFTVLMDPEQRAQHIKKLLKMDGLPYIEENPSSAYCPVSMTSVPDELRPYIKRRQQILMDEVLGPVGIKAYDPSSAPVAPEFNLALPPDEIYAFDLGKVIGSRYFAGHNILPSSGQGVEFEAAQRYLRFGFLLMDKAIRVSRMIPRGLICLAYDDFDEQKDRFVQLFSMTREFEPGFGLNGKFPTVLGFEINGRKIVNMRKLIQDEFPDLVYIFDGNTPIAKLSSVNPEIFYEHGRVLA